MPRGTNLEPLESGAVPACDWSSLRPGSRIIYFLLSLHGGIAPAVRRRSPRALTLSEREDISRGIASGWSIRVIARGLSRAGSTVSREVARHGGRPLYRANEADQQAWQSARGPRFVGWPPTASYKDRCE